METIGKCDCINPDDKHELSKAVIARIELYRKSIIDIEMEEITKKAESHNIGELEIKYSLETTEKVDKYYKIIDRLKNLNKRLENTPQC